MDNLKIIFDQIKPLLTVYVPPMVETSNYESRYELYTDKPFVFANRTRSNLAFASLIIQSKYVGFYFMPIYTHVDIKNSFKPELLSLLKGKSCFHIKKISPELLDQIREGLKIGFDRYKGNEWV